MSPTQPEPQPPVRSFDASLLGRPEDAAADAADRLRATLNLVSLAHRAHEPVRLPQRPRPER